MSRETMYYRPDQLGQLHEGFLKLESDYERLLSAYLLLQLTNEAAYEFVRHGFIRRLGTLKRCIENVYSIYPPERSDQPSRNECVDLAINLQSFIFNVFGCIDNLAWIWVKEKELKDNKGRPLQGQQVGLRSGCVAVRKSLSTEFDQYLISREDWFSYLEDYRHALAHRIPLYVPPYTMHPDKLAIHNELEARKEEARKRRDFDTYDELDAEQEALGRFTPWMTHSYSEGTAPVAFHYQTLIDWSTVVEIAEQFYDNCGLVDPNQPSDLPNASAEDG